jgi:hypothetical protein
VSKTAAAVLASLCLTFLAIPASAQLIPNGNVYVGASYGQSEYVINKQTYRGWNASAEFIPFARFTHIGVVVDGTGLYRSGITQYNFVAGPRLAATFGKWRPFVHAMGGVQRVSSSGNTYNPVAVDVGGGVDYKIFFKNFSWRLQGDYVRTHYLSATQNDYKGSTGIVWRF